MRYGWAFGLLFPLSASAGYPWHIYTDSLMTANHLTPAMCTHYAADHIKKLGFTIKRNDGVEVDARRGNERVIYSCNFGTTYGGRGLLTIVYIPEGKEGFPLVEASDNWKKINSPDLVLYGMQLR